MHLLTKSLGRRVGASAECLNHFEKHNIRWNDAKPLKLKLLPLEATLQTIHHHHHCDAAVVMPRTASRRRLRHCSHLCLQLPLFMLKVSNFLLMFVLRYIGRSHALSPLLYRCSPDVCFFPLLLCVCLATALLWGLRGGFWGVGA